VDVVDVEVSERPKRRLRAQRGGGGDDIDEAPLDGDRDGNDSGSGDDGRPVWWPLREYPDPETADRWVKNSISALIVTLLCGYALWAVHPEWVVQNTTPTGGDMGAHVWGPAYLRDHLLPNLRLSGWTRDWYNGFPAYTFYMVIPSLVIVLLSVGFLPWWLLPVVAVGAVWSIVAIRDMISNRVLRAMASFGIGLTAVLIVEVPYNVAFKLVAISGIVSLPAAVWWFGRGLGLRFGGPELMAAASILFLMDKTLFSIFGGNIASTMAGEFAFSIALSLCFFFLGTMAKGIRTGEHRVAAAVLLSLAVLCHAIVLFYVAIGAIIVLALRPSVRAVAWSAITAVIAAALSAFWYLPFLFNSQYMNDMGWEKSGPLRTSLGLSRTPVPFSINLDSSRTYWKFLLPFAPHPPLTTGATAEIEPNMLHGKVIFALAVIGVVLSIVMFVRSGIALTLMVVASGVAFRFMPQGRFWNARVLPIYYLCIYLLAAVGLFLVLRLIYGLTIWLLRSLGLDDPSERKLVGTILAPILVPVTAVGLVYALVEWTWPFVSQATAIGIWSMLAKLAGPMLWGAVALSVGLSASLFVPGPRSVRWSTGVLVALVSGAVLWNVVAEPQQWQATVAIWILLAMVVGALSIRSAAPRHTNPSTIATSVTVAAAMAVIFVALGMTLQNLPGGGIGTNKNNERVFNWGPFSSTYYGVVRGWAEYNFRGLENKGNGDDKASSNEYFGIVNEMKRVGETSGCGRTMWEYDGDKQGTYGTPMAFMMFPYFSDGCIGSQEGLYFESSATTPYHFLMQDELSQACSCAQRFDIFGFKKSPYSGFNLDLGIRHMQMMGIRYYLAVSDLAKNAAAQDPRLSKVGESGPYVVYAVADAPLVRGLSALPEVWSNVDDEPLDRVGPTAQWFQDPARWDVIPATDGPPDWPRNEAAVPPRHDSLDDEMIAKVKVALADPATFTNSGIDPATLDDVIEAIERERILDPLAEATPPKSVRQAQVSNISESEDSISFSVDQPGTPVLVTSSYFPNWQADGADGPWRVAPNMMVVVPTSNQVTLTYGRSGIEISSMLITFLGIGLLLALIGLGARGSKLATLGEFWGERDDDEPVGLIPRGVDWWRRREAARFPEQRDLANGADRQLVPDADPELETVGSTSRPADATASLDNTPSIDSRNDDPDDQSSGSEFVPPA